jgi:hypothetical protein
LVGTHLQLCHPRRGGWCSYRRHRSMGHG